MFREKILTDFLQNMCNRPGTVALRIIRCVSRAPQSWPPQWGLPRRSFCALSTLIAKKKEKKLALFEFFSFIRTRRRENRETLWLDDSGGPMDDVARFHFSFQTNVFSALMKKNSLHVPNLYNYLFPPMIKYFNLRSKLTPYSVFCNFSRREYIFESCCIFHTV